MIKATREQKGNQLWVRVSGDIEDAVDFNQLVGEIPAGGELVFVCKEVPRINSVGVKFWIQYFQKLSATGVKFKFVECSPAIVQQMNLIINFNCGGAVESIYVPFICPACKSISVGLFKTAELRKTWQNLPEPKCPKCQKANMEFDDIPSEYFGFLERS